MLHGYANPLKRLDTSESVSLHKCLILLNSCRIYATRCLRVRNLYNWPISFSDPNILSSNDYFDLAQILRVGHVENLYK